MAPAGGSPWAGAQQRENRAENAKPMYGWHVVAAYHLPEPVPGPKEKGVISCKPIPRLVLPDAK